MGIVYLLISKFATLGKMIAMTKCGRIARGPDNSIRINLIRSFGCLVISVCVALFGGVQGMSELGLLLAILSGVASALLLYSWVLAATLAPMSTVEVFCMIGGIIPPLILSPILMESETVTLIQWIGALLLFPAAICFRAPSREKGAVRASCIPYVALSAVANAVSVITQKLYTSYEGGGASEFNAVSFGATFTTLLLIFAIKRLIMPKLKNGSDTAKNSSEGFNLSIIIYITLAIVMLYASSYFSVLSSYYLPSALLFTLSYAIGMPLTVVSDIVFFGDKIRVRTIIGAVLVIVSVILTSA